MKMICDVPDEVIKSVRTGTWCGSSVAEKMIANGTPLPKGHGRLIDADKTISKICGNACGCHLEECGYDKPCYSVARINAAPTIIEADTESEV